MLHFTASKQVTGLAEIHAEATTEGCGYRVAWVLGRHRAADCHRYHIANGMKVMSA